MRKKILIIDDEPEFTKSVRLTLEARKIYEVCEVNNPVLALEVASNFMPDLILLDFVMPEIDGGDLYSEFKADPLLKHIPIVFLTAIVTNKEVCEHYGHINNLLFIAKPVCEENLVNVIEDLTKGREYVGTAQIG
jgi:CheY-like chemotaxis protein